MGKKLCLLLFKINIYEIDFFLGAFPTVIKLILLHTVVVLHYTHHIKWHA